MDKKWILRIHGQHPAISSQQLQTDQQLQNQVILCHKDICNAQFTYSPRSNYRGRQLPNFRFLSSGFNVLPPTPPNLWRFWKKRPPPDNFHPGGPTYQKVVERQNILFWWKVFDKLFGLLQAGFQSLFDPWKKWKNAILVNLAISKAVKDPNYSLLINYDYFNKWYKFDPLYPYPSTSIYYYPQITDIRWPSDPLCITPPTIKEGRVILIQKLWF